MLRKEWHIAFQIVLFRQKYAGRFTSIEGLECLVEDASEMKMFHQGIHWKFGMHQDRAQKNRTSELLIRLSL